MKRTIAFLILFQAATAWSQGTDLAICHRPQVCPPISANDIDQTVTKQGNTFNGPSQLVQLLANGKLPALDGSNLFNISGGGSSTGTPNTVTFYDGSGNISSSPNLTFDGTTLGASVYSGFTPGASVTLRSIDVTGGTPGNILIKGGDTSQGGQSSNITIWAGDTDPTNTHGGNGPSGNLILRGGTNKTTGYAKIEILGASNLPGGTAGTINIIAADPGTDPNVGGPVNIQAGAGKTVNLNSDTSISNITQVNTVSYSWPSSQGNDQEVLLNDGSGNLHWGQPLGNSSANQILFNNGAILTGSDNLTFDGTNLTLVGNLAEINTVPYVWTTSQGNLGDVLTNDGTGSLTWAPPYNTAGGTSGQVLYNSGGVETSNGNLLFDGTTLTPQVLSVAGNISSINTVPYVFPNTQGAQNTVLQNDGAGNLTWTSTDTFAVSTFSVTPQWHRYSFTSLDFIIAQQANPYSSTQTYISPVSVPPGAIIHGVKIKQSVRFNVATTTYTISVGILGNNQEFASAFEVTQATGPDVFQISSDFDSINSDVPTPIAIFADTTDTIGNAASGQVDVWLLISVPQEAAPQ